MLGFHCFFRLKTVFFCYFQFVRVYVIIKSGDGKCRIKSHVPLVSIKRQGLMLSRWYPSGLHVKLPVLFVNRVDTLITA